jgi:hypothetical protein
MRLQLELAYNSCNIDIPGANKEEYELFVEITDNEYVPSFMLIENPETDPKSELYAPDRDFDDLEEGVGIIKEWIKN